MAESTSSAVPNSVAPAQVKSPDRRRASGLYLVVFVSGMTTLAVEISTARLAGNVFGTSNIVWSGVIGMTLLYLTVGYFLGGRYADRYPSYSRFYALVAWAGLAAGLVAIVSLPLFRMAAVSLYQIDVAISLVSALSIAILFAVPVTLLGAIPTFAIRLAVQDVASSGHVAGTIYALTTVGSLIGIFGPVLLFIPLIGTSATVTLYAAALILAGMIGQGVGEGRFATVSLWMLIALGGLAFLGLGGPLKPPPLGSMLLHERETQYNYIQVIEYPDQRRELLLNEGLATHSVYHPERIQTGQSWDFFLVGPYFNDPPYSPDRVERVGIVGLAAGTVARQYTHVYGPIPIDGVEIDPGIVEVGQQYFDMVMPNLNVIVQDGRYAVTQLGSDYQIIAIDAYRPPYIPWQLTTVEFFGEVRRHLADDGVVAVNVGRTHVDRRLVEAMTATLLEVFPTVHTMDVPSTFNTILVATVQPTRPENLLPNLMNLVSQGDPNMLLGSSLELAISSLVPTASSDLVFTDDLAPVEVLSDSIVLQFLLGPDAGRLRQQIVPTQNSP